MLGNIEVARKPKLLFLARPFPPLRATACVRTWNIAKYLARLGWEITVVTPHPSVWRHVDNAQATEEVCRKEQIRRILTHHPWPWLAPDHLHAWNRGLGWFAGGVCRRIAHRLSIDGAIGWIKSAEHFCSTLDSSDVDVIFATGSPFGSFGLARRLSARLGRPYVLDYRDPWSGNPHSGHATRSSSVQEEAMVLAHSSAVTIVSPSWAKELARRFSIESKIHVITNGYDPEE